MVRLTAVIMTLVVLTSAIRAGAEDVDVLVILSHYFGGNTFLNLDRFRHQGWEITLAATTQTVTPCPLFDARPITVDVLLSDIQSVAPYDVIAIMPASTQALGTGVYADLLNSPHVLNLIASAVDSGVVLSTICAGPRVLAAADRLQGVNIIGARGPGDAFLNEYLAAGAVYLGDDHSPVIHGNIVTGVRDLHYHVQNVEAIATALENAERADACRIDKSANIVVQDLSFERRNDLVLWSKTFGGDGSEGARSACATADGGAVICGHTFTSGAGNSDVILLKVDTNGNEEWSTTFGGQGWEYGYAVAQTTDGGFIVTGSTTSSGSGQKDVYLFKTDASGTLQWEETIGGSSVDVGCDVLVADDGGFIICGFTESYGPGEDDFYLLRTDADGDTVWTKRFGGTRSETGRSLCRSHNGGVVFFGSVGSADLAEANRDFYALETDMSGNILWSENYNGAYGFSFDWGNSVCQTDDGGYMLLGDGSVNWPMDGYLIRIDGNGSQLWERYLGDEFFDFGTSIIETNEGGHLICGVTKDIETARNDLMIFKTQPDGTTIWNETVGDPLTTEWVSEVCQLSDGNYLLAGQVNSSQSRDSDILLVKLANPLHPLFTAEPVTGHAPLTVSFLDQSAGNITAWEWDFDSNGTVDSYEQHPTWIYDEPGEWSVSLTILDESETETLIKEDYIGVFDGESAMFFDGMDSYANCPPSPELNVVDALTVEAWICPEGWGEGTEGLRFGEVIDKNRFVVTLIGPHPSRTDYCLSFRIYQDTGPTCFTNTLENSIILHGWQHVAVTYSPSTGVAMYINGVLQELVQNVAPSHSIADNSAYDLYVGNSAVRNATFDGAIDEVRVWNIVRTGDQIEAGMSDTLSGTENGLVAYWRMNEGNGLTADDLSGNGNQLSTGDITWVAGTPFLPTSSHEEPTPRHFSLSDGSPNPFRSTISIAYSIPERTHVRLALYDILGREVRTLLSGVQEAGYHSVLWDGRSDDHQVVPSGVYFCRVEAGSSSGTSRCVLMR